VASLLQFIQQEYANHTKLKEFAKGVGLVLFDMTVRAHTNMTLEEMKNYFKNCFDQVKTIQSEVEKAIGANGQLIIFIDDLDRCSLENVIEMIEAIKLFLYAKGVIFIIAADMKKLEAAMIHKYNLGDKNRKEAIEYFDKIFQLKLSLPEKEPIEMANYLDYLVPNLPKAAKDLLLSGSGGNPRRLKRILNVLYYYVANRESENFQEKLPWLIILAVLQVRFSETIALGSKNQFNLAEVLAVVTKLDDMDEIRRVHNLFKSMSPTEMTNREGEIYHYNRLRVSTFDAIEYLINNIDYYEFCCAIKTYLNLSSNNVNNLQLLAESIMDAFDTGASVLDDWNELTLL
jgi:hypothetical protein